MVVDPYWDLVNEPAEPPFDPSATALVIVDMQNMCAHKNGWMGRLADDQGKPAHLSERFSFIGEILPSLKDLLTHCRKIGVEVFHVRIAFRTKTGRDGNKQLLNKLDDTPLIPFDFDFLEEISPLEQEIIINKTSVSTFNSTAIDQVFRNMNINRLWMTGVVTEGCVELTARDAADRGYFVTLVTNACASSTHAAHLDAVQRMSDGNVIRARTSNELIEISQM